MVLVVFTDLDGTLLDHRSYSFEPARPALSALKAHQIPLILATSKTAAEVAPMHAELGLGQVPAIVENGAGIYEVGQATDPAPSAYAAIRDVLDEIPASLRQHYRGFGDVSADDVATWTGLSPQAAQQAKDRRFSEPGLWLGDEQELAAFQQALSDRGIASRYGGRFLTLSHGRTKACAMQEIAQRLGATTTVALGDAPNDIEMLKAADIGVIIRNDHAKAIPALAGEEQGRITRSNLEGPVGWNAAVLEILKKQRLGADGAHG